jgi:hypothetical protein
MNTKTLSTRAMSVIDQYMDFKYGQAVCSVPYFNNKTVRARAALRADSGKGSPKEIFDEVQAILVKNHVSAEALNSETLKTLLTDNNTGIDCSGFAYYVLNAESQEQKKGSMDKHISFTECHGIVGKLRCALRPIENCSVITLANDKNSRSISWNEIQPGDIITMMGGPDNDDRNHVLVIHQVDYQNFVPTQIFYSHAVAYPEDGIYGSGIKQGAIEILKPEGSLLEQRWTENGKEGDNNRIFLRAKNSTTDTRRLKWF